MQLGSHSIRSFDHSFPSPLELREELPVSLDEKLFILQSRKTIQNILEKKDHRIVLIVGPCSIHDIDSIYEYAEKFKLLAEAVKDRFYLVMRSYFEKPRTSIGWKGFLYDPFLDDSYNVLSGLTLARKLLLHFAKEKIAVGCELLELTTVNYLYDLISWGCIGARTSASQPHRQLASNLPFPVGFKNSMDGNLLSAIHGMDSASLPHTFLGLSDEGRLSRVQSTGNKGCHLVLRGSDKKSNYDPESLLKATLLCKEQGVSPQLLIDCAHGNSKKKHYLQIPAFESLVEQILQGNKNISGLMLESHLKEGNQPLSSHLKYGVSITDPCLDWDSTSSLIQAAYQKIIKI